MSADPDKAVLATPYYWDEACRYLSRKDRVMKRLIPRFGDACLQSRGDAFTTLARSIVGQQISVKAAQTVWDRFAKLPRKMTGEVEAYVTLLACSDAPEGSVRWTHRLLADKAVELGYVESLSHVTVGTTLKKTKSNPGVSKPGASASLPLNT